MKPMRRNLFNLNLKIDSGSRASYLQVGATSKPWDKKCPGETFTGALVKPQGDYRAEADSHPVLQR